MGSKQEIRHVIDVHVWLRYLPCYFQHYFCGSCFRIGTTGTGEFSNLASDGKIDQEEWKEFVLKNPPLIKNMTLPYLK